MFSRDLSELGGIALGVLTALVVLILLVFTRSQVGDPPEVIAYNEVGVHLMLDDGRNNWDQSQWATHMEYAARVVGEDGFVVQLIRADDLDVAKWQTFMDLAGEHDMTPILRLATTFDDDMGWWTAPVPDADGSYTSLAIQYADFVGGLEWHTDAKYVAVLNEPNNGHEWGGTPDPAAYARLLVDVANAMQQVEGVQLMNGALDLYAPDTGDEPFPDSEVSHISAVRFMEEMVAAQPFVFDVVDVWNSHSYPIGFSAPPSTVSYGFDTLNDAEPIIEEDLPAEYQNRGVNGYEWELWKLRSLGFDLPPVIITEFGWRHSAGSPDSADAGEGYPTPQTAARYLDAAMQGHPSPNYTPLLAVDRVIGVVVFTLNGAPSEWSHSNLLVMGADGEVLGTYPTFDVLEGYQADGESVAVTDE